MYPSTQILFENDTTPFTVSRLNHQIRTMLEANASHILLIGEISNFSRPTSGHWYFTLKDDSAQIRAAMFRGNNRTVKFNPQNGMQVIVRANVTLYEPRGDYQLVVETIQQAGEGLLQQKFDALKVKLQQEGLFNLEYKKSLPKDPSCVGIITSASGAALQDILHVLKRRDPSLAIVIYPAMVQGQQATDMLVDMIHLANRRQECDVLILARGGGSLEDLWCFNEERLARAIFSSTIPIVSGVGHETDVTIADFVADLRAPTPSAAAELVSRDSVELLQALQRIWQRLQMAVDYHLQYIKQKQDQLVYELKYQDPKLKITRQLMAILTAQNQLVHLINQRVNKEKQELNETKNLLGHFKFYEKGEQKIQALRLRLLACDPLIKTKAYQQEIYRSLVNLQSHILQHIKRKQSTLNSIDSTLYPLAIEGVMSLKKVQAKIEQRFFNIDLQNQVLQAKHTRAWLEQKMVNLTENLLMQKGTELGTFSSQLDSLSPLKYLQRGYAVALTNDNHRIKSRKQVKQGDRINMQVEDGLIITEVLSTSKKPLVQNKKV